MSKILSKPINDLIATWVEQHDVNPVSRNKYRKNVNMFIKWMVQNYPQDIKTPKKAHLINYKQHLIDKKHTNRTIDGYLAALKVFFKWLASGDSDEEYPYIINGVKAMGGYSGHIKNHLKEDQVMKLLYSIDTKTLQGKRDYAMMHLMVSTGLRCVEVERLDVGDINQADGIWIMKVQGRGHTDKDRVMGIPQDTADLIHEYLNHRGVADEGEPVFTTKQGERMRSYLVSRHIKNRLVDIGIDSKQFTAHSLRHTAAVMALNNGATIHDVQIMLGHKDIKTSMIYLSSIEHEKSLASGAVHRNSETLRKAKETYQKRLKNGNSQQHI